MLMTIPFLLFVVHMKPNSFHLFSRLPPELRSRIWHLALRQPRVHRFRLLLGDVTLYSSSTKHTLQSPRSHMLTYALQYETELFSPISSSPARTAVLDLATCAPATSRPSTIDVSSPEKLGGSMARSTQHLRGRYEQKSASLILDEIDPSQ